MSLMDWLYCTTEGCNKERDGYGRYCTEHKCGATQLGAVCGREKGHVNPEWDEPNNMHKGQLPDPDGRIYSW
jgi:hypothetical protein